MYYSKNYIKFNINVSESGGVCEEIVKRSALYETSDSDDAEEISITPNSIKDCESSENISMKFSFNIFIPTPIEGEHKDVSDYTTEYESFYGDVCSDGDEACSEKAIKETEKIMKQQKKFYNKFNASISA